MLKYFVKEINNLKIIKLFYKKIVKTKNYLCCKKFYFYAHKIRLDFFFRISLKKLQNFCLTKNFAKIWYLGKMFIF